MKVCVATIVRGENNYLAEWVRYCTRIGFDRICIYDNNDPNGENPKDVIDVMSNELHGVDVRVIDRRAPMSKNYAAFHLIQMSAMQDAYDTACKDKFDWVFIADVDEYLEGVENVKEWLKYGRFAHADAICVRWKIYDDNDLLDVVDGDYSVVSRFTRPMPENRGNYSKTKKMFIRCIPGVKVHEHGTSDKLRVVDVCGQKYIGNSLWFHKLPDKGKENVRLAHYKCMTAGEFIRKKMSMFPPGPGWYNSVATFFTVNRDTPEKRAMFKNMAVSRKVDNTPLSY